LDNALKFTERGMVACHLYRTADGRLCLEIRDSGIGISEEYLPHLFQPFSQEDSGNVRRFQGSGLDLALTLKYLELDGAELSVESERVKVRHLLFGSREIAKLTARKPLTDTEQTLRQLLLRLNRKEIY
jgi:signal transduction histidine kinase